MNGGHSVNPSIVTTDIQMAPTPSMQTFNGPEFNALQTENTDLKIKVDQRDQTILKLKLELEKSAQKLTEMVEKAKVVEQPKITVAKLEGPSIEELKKQIEQLTAK